MHFPTLATQIYPKSRSKIWRGLGWRLRDHTSVFSNCVFKRAGAACRRRRSGGAFVSLSAVRARLRSLVGLTAPEHRRKPVARHHTPRHSVRFGFLCMPCAMESVSGCCLQKARADSLRRAGERRRTAPRVRGVQACIRTRFKARPGCEYRDRGVTL